MLGKFEPILYFIFGLLVMFLMLEIRNKCYIKGNVRTYSDKIIKKLIRQAARWSTASTQDESAMISNLHANYGAGYLWSLKDIASDSEIEAATGIDIKRFEDEIIKAQDYATQKMAGVCPKFAPKSTYLTKLGGEGN